MAKGDTLTIQELQERHGTTTGNRVFSIQDLQREEPDEKIGFLGRVAEDIKVRGEKFQEILSAQRGGAQTSLETGLQFAGQTIGTAFDVGGEALVSTARGLSAITPDIIEDPIKKAAAEAGIALLQTDIGQTGLQALQRGSRAFEEFSENNPRAARDLEALFNISAAIPAGTITRATAKSTAKAAGIAGRALEEGGEAAIAEQKQSFVRELVRPELTKKALEAEVPRTTEVGGGVFKGSVVEPTPQLLRAEQALLDVPEIDPEATVQQNFNAVQEANRTAAEQLKKDIAANDFNFPKQELKAALQNTREALESNPVLVGDAAKTADKLIAEIERRVNAAAGKGSALLQVRKDFDQWVRLQKGDAAFEKQNAFGVANREIRQTINTFLDERIENVGVKESLSKQSALFDAMENITPKAAKEANTAVVRAFTRAAEAVGIKNKFVQQIATIAGIGGLGAAATFAPAVAVGLGATLLVLKGKNFVLNPKLRTALGKFLQNIDKKINATDNPTAKAQLISDRDELRELTKEK